jgi:prepilin peptidase CpaA
MQNKIYLDLALAGLLFCASGFDLARRRIPNRLLAVGLLAALMLHLGSANPGALLSTCLAGFALGLLMFLPLYLLGGMAAGDVKLMAAVGAFIGPGMVFQASLATYCVGGLMAVLIVLARGQGRAALANVGALLHPWLLRLGGAPLAPAAQPAPSVGGMPYALAITLGTVLVMWLHHS